MLPAAGQITQIVAARIMDAGEHLAPAAEMVLAELAFQRADHIPGLGPGREELVPAAQSGKR